ncbi:71 kDa [Pelobates cultripes]|uniref:71 kDa n=1 Tax=Pelobates cultripes TaxID=61616 RepID=A0AAD1WSD9_PELCU|nr:71 kDa [Pelobates cultripes]
MEAYRKQSKEALELLCQEKNLPTFGKNKAQLIADLVEADSHIFQPETDTERVTELPTTAGVLLTEMPGGCTPQNIKDICSTDLFRQLMAANPQEALHVMIQQQAAERESAEREAQRRHELELAKLQFTLQSSLNSNASESSTRRLRKDDFPSLEEGTDLDVFFKSFEKVCRQHQLPSDQWGRYLTPQLKGKALDVFVSLPPETDNNYEAIKSALQKTFNLTPESYRKKFRSMQQCPSSSCILYVAQLETTFRQWVTGVQATTYEALNDLLVLEQFLQTRSPNVREWILERKPKNARAAAELADDYADIHAPTSKRGLVSAATSTWREATVQSPPVRSAVRTSPPTASVARAISRQDNREKPTLVVPLMESPPEVEEVTVPDQLQCNRPTKLKCKISKISEYYLESLTVTWLNQNQGGLHIVHCNERFQIPDLRHERQPDNTYSCTACLNIFPLRSSEQGAQFIFRVEHPSLEQPIERRTKPLQVTDGNREGIEGWAGGNSYPETVF